MWYGNATNQDCKALQRVVHLADASQGLLSPLCRTSTSNAVKAELLKSSKTQITPVNHLSVYCHLASASGAWWQKLKDWEELLPSGHRLLNTNPVINTYKIVTGNTSIPLITRFFCVHTLNNPSAHPFYSYHYLLNPSTLFFFCTSYCFAHLIVLHFLYCTFTLISFFLYHIYALVWWLLLYNSCFFYSLHCPLSGPDLIHFTSSYTLYNLLCDK